MRSAILAVIMVAMSGCVTPIKYTYQEQCAMQGLKFVGVTQSSQSAFASNFRGQSVMISGYGDSVSCRAIESEAEKSEVSGLAQIMRPKFEYNDRQKQRNALVGLGYLFYVIPGIGAKLYYDNEYDKALIQASEIEKQLSTPTKAPLTAR